MVYKYLSLKDVTVTHGLHFGDKDIKVIISGIAIMQLLDLRKHISLEEKMCGFNAIFMAPELQ